MREALSNYEVYGNIHIEKDERKNMKLKRANSFEYSFDKKKQKNESKKAIEPDECNKNVDLLNKIKEAKESATTVIFIYTLTILFIQNLSIFILKYIFPIVTKRL